MQPAGQDSKTGKKRNLPKGPGPGRPKGMQNKTTVLAKDAIQRAAEGLGGAQRLIEWAKEAPENERVFWGSIYTKLLPLQVTGEGGSPLQVQILRLTDSGALE